MAGSLPKGGPASLFIGFIIWGIVMWAVNECFGTNTIQEANGLNTNWNNS
jgi:amino acid permease